MLAEEAIPNTVEFFIHVGFISALVLWFWMLGNFFHSGPRKFRILIGFTMLFFNMLSGPIYWITYYVRQKKS